MYYYVHNDDRMSVCVAGMLFFVLFIYRSMYILHLRSYARIPILVRWIRCYRVYMVVMCVLARSYVCMIIHLYSNGGRLTLIHTYTSTTNLVSMSAFACSKHQLKFSVFLLSKRYTQQNTSDSERICGFMSILLLIFRVIQCFLIH